VGHGTVTRDSKDNLGEEIVTGIYSYHPEAGDYAKPKESSLLK
jgi:hypothetical protein